MEQLKKPKYNTLQNVTWMCKNAWEVRIRTIIFGVAMAALTVSISLLQLFVAPEILKRVEQMAPLSELFGTIAFFTVLLFITTGLKEYVNGNALYARVDVRSYIIGKLSYKCNTTSYLNTLDTDMIKLREKAYNSVDNNRAAGEHIWEILTLLLQNIAGFAIYLTLLSNLDWWIILLIIATSSISFICSKKANEWTYVHQDEEEKYSAQHLYIRDKAESVALAKDVRIFGLQNWLNDIHNGVINLHRAFTIRRSKVKITFGIADVLLTAARNGIAYIYIINLALRQGLSASEFLLYFTAVSTFTTWVTGILQETVTLHRESLDISCLREFLEYPEPFRFEEGKPIPEAKAYELKLENVSFRYLGAEKDTIHNVNLTVHAGEKLAIVGLNGAGKTTIVKLLSGLFDPTEGRVLLNGQDIRQFNRRDYYGLFSAVFQDFSLLDVTVAENIAQTKENIDWEKVNDCIEKAGLTQKIAELPKGLDSHIGRYVFEDGVELSGGQTQRLMLARALYKDGPILLLDEPTAALDPIAENDIYMKYDEMTSGKTSIFISHRLASTRFCDHIIFVKDGDITEEGTHEELLALNGEYANLFEVQSRYYKEGRDF